jgi:hypothetical protein
MGLMTFPSDDACATGQIVVDTYTGPETPAGLQGQADQIKQVLAAPGTGPGPGGASPTTLTLQALESYAPLLDGRNSLVVLATDGPPECNPGNPNSYCDGTQGACNCQFNPVSQCTGQIIANQPPYNALSSDQLCRLGCVDTSGTEAVVQALLNRGIKTAVVGFGGETIYGPGPAILNAIASAGGAPRACPHGTDAECGPGSCQPSGLNCCDAASGLCKMRYYYAPRAAEMAAAMATIGYNLSAAQDACVQTLDVPPADASALTVLVNGAALAPGADTWTFSGSTVTFHGATCTLLMSSTPGDPVVLEFQSVRLL